MNICMYISPLRARMHAKRDEIKFRGD